MTSYSYATLTTLGYGDITPTTLWAGSFAGLEAIVGVLYIAILMARLVGLYAHQKI
ncbi:MAG: ion channel [bacterium]|nr:ion channel [bacterium]